MQTETQALIRLRGVGKSYPTAGGDFHALSTLDLDIHAGEFVAVVGPSGSGKSTLLNLLAGIDRAGSGELSVAGQDLRALPERALSRWRGKAVGVVFQFFQLLPTLTALENVMLPMDFCDRWPAAERPERARALLQRLGVADQADKFPAALSGGQQQRVALARALANAPALILADEPTGNLDSVNAEALLTLLAELAREQGVTIVMVTHEAAALGQVQRSLRLRDGRLVEDRRHA
ncbi:MAG: ABC transporter ATP-binding protein [Burkholderiales bacterium]|jgi:putative ABC transport system ATP-binding protein|nr:ABC transporter ATP-binding protein [Burkholderiales bacterium]